MTGIAVQPVSISVNSSAPLRYATIYSGLDKVFLRIRPNATSDSHHIGLTLLLNGVLQKNLVLVVVDELNRTAVSFPFRSIKAGTRAPSVLMASILGGTGAVAPGVRCLSLHHCYGKDKMQYECSSYSRRKR